VVSISLICAIANFIVLQPIPVNALEKEVNVQIAYQGPLSGPESPLGQGELEAAKYAVSNFNDFYQGQIKVQLKTFDDQGDPVIAMKVAPIAAADSNVIGLVGPAYSAASIASLPFYKESSLTMISPSASRGDMTNPYSSAFGSPVFHRVVAVEKQKGARINSWAIQGVSNPRIFVVTDSYRPTEWLSDLAPSATRAGVLNMNDYYGKESTIIPIILNSNPNIVVIDSYEVKSELLRDLKKSGYNGKFIATDNWAYEQNIQLALSDLWGLQFVELTPSSLKDIDSQLELEYFSKISKPSQQYALQTIDATSILLHCIASGVRARLEMLKCVKGFSGRSVTGELFSFDNYGDSTSPFLTINSIVRGQIVREKITLTKIVPQFSDLVTTKDGFEFRILNFESKGNYWIKSTAGIIKQTGNLISVNNLEPGQTASIVIATSLQLLSLNSNAIVGKAGLTVEQIEKEAKLAVEKILAEAEARAQAIREAQKLAEAKTEAERKIAEAKVLAEKIVAEAIAAAELKAKQDAEAKAAAELKAKQDAEAKAAAELKAKQDAEAKVSATKKTTITCVKGKLTKKVTAVKPKCPSGYKVKK
jgi:branched-chain amino acid transport system substrate-binding protein